VSYLDEETRGSMNCYHRHKMEATVEIKQIEPPNIRSKLGIPTFPVTRDS